MAVMHDQGFSAWDGADCTGLAVRIKQWGRELGLSQVAICDTDLSAAEPGLLNWLQQGLHGEMDYMARHGTRRSRPGELIPGTVRIVSARLDYWPRDWGEAEIVLQQGEQAYVSRYALGRDYHKVLRRKLQQLAERMQAEIGEFGYRVFVDSAPVMEVALAEKAGLGWRGKHTLLLTREAGSLYFLGEIYTNLPLPVDEQVSAHCGDCTACITACPTAAIVAPYQLDARRCISYLTIEQHGSIPVELRPLLGNRIYGCDDCQLACPWNRFARLTQEADFLPRHGLESATLVELFGWSEAEFMQRLEGSAIRRIGYISWLRNLAVALGNAPTKPDIVAALRARATHESPLVREHVAWALERHGI